MASEASVTDQTVNEVSEEEMPSLNPSFLVFLAIFAISATAATGFI